MNCKNCLHHKVCASYSKRESFVTLHCAEECPYFNNESEWVHLPCKVGDTVYQIDAERIYESKIRNIIYDTDSVAFDDRAIGKSIFLTREEAEKALKERSEK